jgi:hypothetical protein
MAEPLDHRPTGGIRQSRKCCSQSIHNHMVVDYPPMSSGNSEIRNPRRSAIQQGCGLASGPAELDCLWNAFWMYHGQSGNNPD